MLKTPNDTDRQRDLLVEANMGLAYRAARRYAGRGQDLEDLNQVALLALVGAALRFDPDRGFSFTTFAGHTIEGALKRHFRDHGWAIRPPRSRQEQYLNVNAAIEVLTRNLRRAPDTAEVAAYGDWSEQQVRDALSEQRRRTVESWDAGGESGHSEPAEIESGFERVEHRVSLENLLANLAPRARTVLQLRTYHGLTQAEIGDRIGVSQMQVCRILKSTLQSLRHDVDAQELAS